MERMLRQRMYVDLAVLDGVAYETAYRWLRALAALSQPDRIRRAACARTHAACIPERMAEGMLQPGEVVWPATYSPRTAVRCGMNLAPLMQELMASGSLAARQATLLDASAAWWEDHRQYEAPYIRYRFQEVDEGQDEQASSDMIAVYSQLIAQAQVYREIGSESSPIRLANYLHFLYLCAFMTWPGRAGTSLADEFKHVLSFFLQGAAYR